MSAQVSGPDVDKDAGDQLCEVLNCAEITSKEVHMPGSEEATEK